MLWGFGSLHITLCDQRPICNVWSILKEVLICITTSVWVSLWLLCWPWLTISFQKLVKTGENNWSLPELVHAVVLLAHYHALASFVFGSGINPEREPGISNGFRLISVNSFCVCDLANDNSIENTSLAGSNFGVRSQLFLLGPYWYYLESFHCDQIGY